MAIPDAARKLKLATAGSGPTLKTGCRKITVETIYHFIQATQDDNPIHCSDEEARKHGFLHRVVHGKLVQCIALDLVRRIELVRGVNPILLGDSWRSREPAYPGDILYVHYRRKNLHGLYILDIKVYCRRPFQTVYVMSGQIKARLEHTKAHNIKEAPSP